MGYIEDRCQSVAEQIADTKYGLSLDDLAEAIKETVIKEAIEDVRAEILRLS